MEWRSQNRDECRQLLRHLVHAKSQCDYQHYLEELFAITDDDVHDYFKENWEDCKPMWVTYERDQYLHFANTTNNRLKSHNQKLKDLTSKSSCLSELFENVLLYSRTAASKYSHQSFTEEFTAQYDVSNSSEIQHIFQAVCMCTVCHCLNFGAVDAV